MTTNGNHRLANKIALITGAGSGFGRATSFRFAREGAKVIAVDRDLPSAEATVASIKKDCGTDALAIKCDISNKAEVGAMGKEVFEKFPRLDILINNAGIAMSSIGELSTISEKTWDEVMNVNLRGTWLVTREFARRMKKQELAGELRGKIIVVSSFAGRVPITPLGAYSISKAGLIAMTQVFAQELAPSKITVNAICPGFHLTGIYLNDEKTVKEGLKWSNRKIPLERIGTADDVAKVMYFLASDDSNYMTGQSIGVDGGCSAV